MRKLQRKRRRRSQKRFTEDDDNILLAVLKQLYHYYDVSTRLHANWKEVQVELNKRLKGKSFDVYQVNQHWLRVLSKKVDGNFNWLPLKNKRKRFNGENFYDIRKGNGYEEVQGNGRGFPQVQRFEDLPPKQNVDMPLLWKPKHKTRNYFDHSFEFDLLSYVAMNIQNFGEHYPDLCHRTPKMESVDQDDEEIPEGLEPL